MGLRLEIVSKNRRQLGASGVREFGQDGGTIGRSVKNDWSLPDPACYLSSRHASIDYRSGSYYIVDTSTNGVFVNESDEPVGRGKPQRLFTGDRIRIGDYVMVAIIDIDDKPVDALVLKDHVDPVDRALRVESPDPTTCDLLSEQEITGIGLEIILEGNGEFTVERNQVRPGRAPLELSLEEDGAATMPAGALAQAAPAKAQSSSTPPARRAATSASASRPAASDGATVRVPTIRAGAAAPSASARAPAASTGSSSPAKSSASSASAQALGRSATSRSGASQPGAAQLGARQPGARPPGSEAGSANTATQRVDTRSAAETLAIRRTGERSPTHAPAEQSASAKPTLNDVALVAFFKGAGIEHRELDGREAMTTMFVAGQLVRELLTGLSESLHIRSQQKSLLRLDSTMIQKRGNNALKFATGAEEALNRLLFELSTEYLGPVESVRDAFAGISQHQHALMAALGTAMASYLSRLNPALIESKFGGAGQTSQLATTGKAKFWEAYQDLFKVACQHDPGKLPAQFLEELGSAYLAVVNGGTAAGERSEDAQSARG